MIELPEQRSRPAQIPLKRSRLLIVGSGAFSISQLPQWIILMRRWYDWDIRAALTHSARPLVGFGAVAAATGHPIIGPEWPTHGGVPHQEAATWPDVVLVAPATMNMVSKLALGISDSLALNILACTSVPIVIAPSIPHQAMNRISIATNLEKLIAEGFTVVPPQKGPSVHSGDVVEGGMAALGPILQALYLAVTDTPAVSSNTIGG